MCRVNRLAQRLLWADGRVAPVNNVFFVRFSTFVLVHMSKFSGSQILGQGLVELVKRPSLARQSPFALLARIDLSRRSFGSLKVVTVCLHFSSPRDSLAKRARFRAASRWERRRKDY